MLSCVYRLTIRLFVLAVFCLSIGSNLAKAQSVTWQILPFPDSNWGGSNGQPASTNGNVVTLQGQPVRTLETFSGSLRIAYDVILDARATSDGALILYFTPPGVSTNKTFPNMSLEMVFRNSAGDILMVQTNINGTAVEKLWDTPFSLSAQTVYHVEIDISATGNLSWTINNQTNTMSSTIRVPYPQYQLEFQGWQPDDVWHVSNFTVVPEPSALALAGFGIMTTLSLRRRRLRTGTE